MIQPQMIAVHFALIEMLKNTYSAVSLQLFKILV